MHTWSRFLPINYKADKVTVTGPTQSSLSPCPWLTREVEATLPFTPRSQGRNAFGKRALLHGHSYLIVNLERVYLHISIGAVSAGHGRQAAPCSHTAACSWSSQVEGTRPWEISSTGNVQGLFPRVWQLPLSYSCEGEGVMQRRGLRKLMIQHFPREE